MNFLHFLLNGRGVGGNAVLPFHPCTLNGFGTWERDPKLLVGLPTVPEDPGERVEVHLGLLGLLAARWTLQINILLQVQLSDDFRWLSVMVFVRVVKMSGHFNFFSRKCPLAPRLAPLLLFFRPATNRDRPAANRDRPATNRDIVFWTRKQISTKWKD